MSFSACFDFVPLCGNLQISKTFADTGSIPYQYILLSLISMYISKHYFHQHYVHIFLKTPLFKRKLTMFKWQNYIHCDSVHPDILSQESWHSAHCQQYLFTLSPFLHHAVRTVNFRPCSLLISPTVKILWEATPPITTSWNSQLAVSFKMSLLPCFFFCSFMSTLHWDVRQFMPIG